MLVKSHSARESMNENQAIQRLFFLQQSWQSVESDASQQRRQVIHWNKNKKY